MMRRSGSTQRTDPNSPRRRRRGILGSVQGKLGVGLLLFMVLVATCGGLVAPHSIAEPVGPPGVGPTAGLPLGTDYLGRDVLSRVLQGGMNVLVISSLAVGVAYVIGTAIGLIAGSSTGLLDPILMRAVDLVYIFPAILLLLVLLTGAGNSDRVLVVGIVLVTTPGIARVVRAAALEVSTTGFVEAAIVRGESKVAVLRREVLPNIMPTILADLGVRFSSAVILTASVTFLGLGASPPAANWALMISENRSVVATNVWSLLAPAIMLAALTVAVNLISDAYVQTRRSGGRK